MNQHDVSLYAHHKDPVPVALAVPTADLDDDDIYRGEPPLSPLPRPRTTSTGSSSSSSSSASGPGGRLGAFAAVVENAITRWARANWSTSSLDSSSTSSSSSSSSSDSAKTYSTRPTRPRRRRRNTSQATLIHAQSEKEVADRIRAREEFRQAPRQFSLYLPPTLATLVTPGNGSIQDHMIRTDSLDDVMAQLDVALKHSARLQRIHERKRFTQLPETSSPHSSVSSSYRDTDPRQSSMPLDVGRMRRVRKGKDKESPSVTSRYLQAMTQHHSKQLHSSLGPTPTHMSQKAWFLDVTSPTWEDMRALGKVSLYNLLSRPTVHCVT
jgi:magnesium transporter